jgi:hypothetical protein
MAAYYRGTPRAQLVADRFYRRALRSLDEGAPPRWTEIEAKDPLSWVVRRRLAELSVGAKIWRRRRRILPMVGGLAIVFVIAVAAIPGLRRGVFPPDLAAGKMWKATSAWADFPRSGIMSDATRTEGLFHTVEEPSPAITLDLGAVLPVHEIKVDNREDCCRERSLPLALELSVDGTQWQRVGYRRAQFDTWTVTFRRRGVRFVRARVDRTSILHLRRLRVY